VLRTESGPGALLALIRESGGLTTRELIARSGLARATVESRLAKLVSGGFVVQGVQDRGTGRPPRVFMLNEAGGLLAAVDIGPARTAISVTDLACKVLASTEFDIDVSAGPGLVLGEVASRLKQLLARERLEPGLMMGVAIGLPGAVDLSGEMARPPRADLPGVRTEWADVRVAREVRAFLPALGMRPVPVVVDNGANCLAQGEWLTSWPQTRNLLVVRLDMSLACGIISNGQLLRGANGMAGDLAHIPDERSEVRCTCGQNGCASAVASGQGIARLLGARGRELRSTRDLVRLADTGDREVLDLLRHGAHRLGVVLGTAISTIDPELVVLGGGLMEGLPNLAEEVRRVALSQVHPLVAAHTAVLNSQIAPAAALTGAAHLALDQALQPTQVDIALEEGLVLAMDAGD
jgi:glucokinase